MIKYKNILNYFLISGGVTYKYNKKRKIPLLEDILKVTSKRDIIHYLEVTQILFFLFYFVATHKEQNIKQNIMTESVFCNLSILRHDFYASPPPQPMSGSKQ